MSQSNPIDTWMDSTIFSEYKNNRINCYTHDVINADGHVMPGRSSDLIQEIYESLREVTLAMTMPVRFIAVLMTFSNSSDIGEAFSEWEMHTIRNDTNLQCICSHWIVQNLYVINKINKNILVVGNECIKKFPFNDTVKNVAKRQITIKKKLCKTTKYKTCEICFHDIVPENKVPCICDECHNNLRLLQFKQEQLQREKQIELQREFELELKRQRNLQLQQQLQLQQEIQLQEQLKRQEQLKLKQEIQHQEQLKLQQEGKSYYNDPYVMRVKEQIARIGIQCLNSICINNYERDPNTEPYICELCFSKNITYLQKRMAESSIPFNPIKLKSINWIIYKCQNLRTQGFV